MVLTKYATLGHYPELVDIIGGFWDGYIKHQTNSLLQLQYHENGNQAKPATIQTYHIFQRPTA